MYGVPAFAHMGVNSLKLVGTLQEIRQELEYAFSKGMSPPGSGHSDKNERESFMLVSVPVCRVIRVFQNFNTTVNCAFLRSNI